MVESIILKSTTSEKSVLIDQFDSPFVLGEVDFGAIQGTHTSYKYFDQIGAYIDNTTLEQRSISISGWVIGDTYDLLRLNKQTLNSLINPKDTLQVIVYDKYVLTFKPDYTIKYSVPYKDNNDVLCKFLIQGTCPDPMFTTIAEQGAIISAIIPKFRFPLVIPQNRGIIMGLKTPSLLATVVNPGDVETGFVVKFKALSVVTNPSLSDVVSGKYLKLLKDLNPGEEVFICTDDGNKYIKGVVSQEEYNYFRYRDWGSSWFKLQPGENVLKYDADNNVEGLEVTVTFLPKFLEVQ